MSRFNINAKKYFLYVIPAAVIFRIIAFFTIDVWLPNLYGRLLNFGILLTIFLVCLKFAQKTDIE